MSSKVFLVNMFSFLKRSTEEPDDLAKYDFLSFARMNFENDEACRFSRAPLLSPLLSAENDEDRKVTLHVSSSTKLTDIQTSLDFQDVLKDLVASRQL